MGIITDKYHKYRYLLQVYREPLHAPLNPPLPTPPEGAAPIASPVPSADVGQRLTLTYPHNKHPQNPWERCYIYQGNWVKCMNISYQWESTTLIFRYILGLTFIFHGFGVQSNEWHWFMLESKTYIITSG